MPVLLCNLATACLGAEEEQPFRRALDEASGRSLCGKADRFHNPLELVDSAYRDFQTGRIGESEYARHLRVRLGWTGTDAELLELFDDSPSVVHLGALEALLDAVAEGWTLVALENSSPWQEQSRRLLYEQLAVGPFRRITSLDLGCRLSDPRAFTHAWAFLRGLGRDVLYVDRDAVHVAAARDAGLAAYLLRCSKDLSAALRDVANASFTGAPVTGPTGGHDRLTGRADRQASSGA